MMKLYMLLIEQHACNLGIRLVRVDQTASSGISTMNVEI